MRSIFLSALLLLVGCKEQIIHDLSESESNRLIARLDEGSISAKKVKQSDGKWAIAVEGDQSIAALKFISENRLLVEHRGTSPERTSIISSREDQRFRYERALSQEVEATILNIPGILDARVHLNLPPVDPLFGQPLSGVTGSASVLVVAAAKDIERSELEALVSGASGIPASSVSVLIKVSGPAVNHQEANNTTITTGETQLPTVVPETQEAHSISTTLHTWIKDYSNYGTLIIALSLILFGSMSLIYHLRARRFRGDFSL